MPPRRSIGLVALLLVVPLTARAQDKSKGSPASGPLAAVHTSFDPVKDGLGFPNVGSFVSPEGDCVGFSAVAIANAQTRAESGAAPLDGLQAEAQAIAVQAAYAKKLHDGAYFLDEEDPLSLKWKAPADPSVGQALYDLLGKSGPQILEIQAASFGPKVAHAIAVYGYEDGHFLVYDSNSPGEAHKLPFDPKSGFGSLEPYGKLTKLKLMQNGADFVALAAKLQPSCSALDGTCAADVYKVSAERVHSDTAIVFSGSVSGGLPTRSITGAATDAPAYVVANINGRRYGETRVHADGSFTLQLPAGTTGTVRFWAFTNGNNGASQIAGYSTSTYDLGSSTSTSTTATKPSSPTVGFLGALEAAAAGGP